MQKNNIVDINCIKNDSQQRSDFIEKYMPFIASEVSKVTRKAVNYGEDDELSIGMIAFNEAIEKYNGSKNFFEFAKMVMRSRLKDYYKSQKKHLSDEGIFNDEEQETKGVIDFSKALEVYRQQDEDRRSEIVSLCDTLKEYDIDFISLAKVSPKHKEKKKMVDTVILHILKNDDMIKNILKDKMLPMKKIEESLSIPRKKIETYRKYIIVMIVIACSDNYQYLKQYLSFEQN